MIGLAAISAFCMALFDWPGDTPFARSRWMGGVFIDMYIEWK